MAEKEFSKSKKLAARVVFAALTGIKKSGGQLPVQEVLKYVEDNTELDAWAKEKYEKTGYIRWQSILHFYSIDVQKAGFLLKKNGVWYITPEGEEAVKLGEIGLHKAGSEAYKKWKITNLAFMGDRLDSIFSATQKGSHKEICTREEAERYVIYSYLLLGDILTLEKKEI